MRPQSFLALIIVSIMVATSGCLVLLTGQPSQLAKSEPRMTMEESLEGSLRALAKELPSAFDGAKIVTVALIDIVGVDGRITALDRLVLERATGALAQLGGYRVVERDRIDKVRSEIKLNLSDIIDQKTAIEAGKLMGADALLTGTRFDYDDEVEVALRIIASRTGQVVWTAPMRISRDRRARSLLAQQVARETRGSKPPLQLSMFVLVRRDREARVLQDRDVLRSGDKFQVHLQTNVDSYSYVILVEQGGRVQVLFPSEGNEDVRVQAGAWRVLPRREYWFFLDNRPGTETIYGLASYEPLDLKALVAQLQDGVVALEPRVVGAGSETSISQEIIQHQRATPIRPRESAGTDPVRPLLQRGQSLRMRGAAGVVEDGVATIQLPDTQSEQKVSHIVQGYTTAVSSVIYLHQ